MNCAKCTSQVCQIRQKEGLPENCPMLDKDLIEKGLNLYNQDGNDEFLADSFKSMKNVMGKMSRVMEAVSFCKQRGYKKIGVAYCSGMLPYGRAVVDIFEAYGFEVVSAGCKTGAFTPDEMIDVEKFGMNRPAPIAPPVSSDSKPSFVPMFPKDGKIPAWPTPKPGEHPRPPVGRSICNPLGQVTLLNEEKTEFNVIAGLCVGHDSLVLKNSDAPCTVVVVKDRLYHDICKPAVEAAYEYCKNDVNKNFFAE